MIVPPLLHYDGFVRSLMRSLAVLGAVVLLTACDEVAGPSAALNERFTLARGETSEVQPIRTFITFVGVDGDSRCPGDALCITGGDARVLIDVQSTGPGRRYELHTGDLKPVVHDGSTITMVDLRPYPFSSLPPIQPDDYRVTLTVSR